MYGCWISADGGITEVPGQCEHNRYKDYIEAYKEGWIAQTNGEHFYCAKWNPNKVTLEALKTLRREVRKAKRQDFMFDTLLDNFTNMFGMGKEDGSKVAAMEFLNKLIAEKKK